MSVSPTLSTASSFSSISSTSSDHNPRSTPKMASSPVFRLTRPTHKRTISDFTSSQTHKKVRRTTHKNKNILLWPSQLHSLDVASKEAKQRGSTPAMSRESSTQSNISIQDDPVILGYMEALQKQQKRDLARIPSLSRAVSRQPSLSP